MSQTLELGKKLSLVCQANVSDLNGVDYYTMPAINWRFEGANITDGGQWNIKTDTDLGYSSLQVPSVGYEHAGSYDCLVNDSDGHFVTVSRIATVEVVENGMCLITHTYTRTHTHAHAIKYVE